MLASGAIPVRPGVRRLLEEARTAGLRLAVVTTTTPENVTGLLRHSLDEHAESWFEVIAAGDIVPAKKPAPDIYHWALEKMQLDPTQCLAFEDSHNGLRASCGAGVKTVVTVNGYTAHEAFDTAITVLSDLGEPDAPFDVLQGDAFGESHVNLPLLRRWFQD
jgi:HAD superfamily hydrolase (TIGR01509 family)